MNEEELKKGCGKYYTRGAYTFTCGTSSLKGKIQLCPTCKARLEGYTLATEDVLKKIDDKIKKIVDAFNIEEDYKHKLQLGSAYEVLNKFKASLKNSHSPSTSNRSPSVNNLSDKVSVKRTFSDYSKTDTLKNSQEKKK